MTLVVIDLAGDVDEQRKCMHVFMHTRRLEHLLEHPPIGDQIRFSRLGDERQLCHFTQREGPRCITVDLITKIGDAIDGELVLPGWCAEPFGRGLDNHSTVGRLVNFLEPLPHQISLAPMARR